MVFQDVEFDEAYMMYQNMQLKHALGVEQMQKGQMMNPPESLSSSLSAPTSTSGSTSTSSSATRQNNLFQDDVLSQFLEHGQPLGHGNTQFQEDELDIFAHLPDFATNEDGANEQDEADQFFSNTEATSLSKFLDNLAHPTGSSNPMYFYSSAPSSYNQYFSNLDLHTMKPSFLPTPPSRNSGSPKSVNRSMANAAAAASAATSAGAPPPSSHPSLHDLNPNVACHDKVKNELAEAFSHPPTGHFSDDSQASQLPTPLDSRQSSTSETFGSHKRSYSEESYSHPHTLAKAIASTTPPSSPPMKKRKRTFHKPLLTLEQKRLNHSYSEQKRRQLCKSAYERCLRLITNASDYIEKNDGVKKKSKRKQLTKEGLPNLSKYTALIKISNEITKIQSQNDGLKRLLTTHNVSV